MVLVSPPTSQCHHGGGAQAPRRRHYRTDPPSIQRTKLRSERCYVTGRKTKWWEAPLPGMLACRGLTTVERRNPGSVSNSTNHQRPRARMFRALVYAVSGNDPGLTTKGGGVCRRLAKTTVQRTEFPPSDGDVLQQRRLRTTRWKERSWARV
jgi:hypothetical protein